MFTGFNEAALYGDVSFSRFALPDVSGPATGITLSGPLPASGTVGVASTALTVGANGPVDFDTIVTPTDSSGAGSFSPATVTILAGQSIAGATFTYTPLTTGVRSIGATNNAGLTVPPGVLYTVISVLVAADTTLYIVPARGRDGRRISRKRLSAKDPEEAVIVTFDYTEDLAVGETLSTPVVTSIVLFGTDPAPATMIAGVSEVDGPLVKQLVIGGIAGINYRLQCVANTNYGQELVLAGTLPVREA